MRELWLLLLLVPILADRVDEQTPRDLGHGLLLGIDSTVVFLTQNNTKVVAHQGSRLSLSCRLTRPPNSGLVTWSRRLRQEPGIQVLSIGDYTHINDQRFLVVKKPSDDDWKLVVQGIAVSDSGEYQCQASTHPPSHILTAVTVVEAFAAIKVEAAVKHEGNTESRHSENAGPREIFIKQGSQLLLICELKKATARPQFLFWYHNGRVVNHSPDLGKVVSRPPSDWGSSLLIKSASPEEGGNYTCSPQAIAPDTVRISIMQGEGKQAAVQRDSTSAAIPQTLPSTHLTILPIILLILLLPDCHSPLKVSLHPSSSTPLYSLLSLLSLLGFLSLHPNSSAPPTVHSRRG